MKASDVRDLSQKDILSTAGLDLRRDSISSVLSSVGLFSAGLLVGAGAALLLAPKSGRGLREDISARLQRTREAIIDALPARETSDSSEQAGA
jgi:YtxH-like protein